MGSTFSRKAVPEQTNRRPTFSCEIAYVKCLGKNVNRVLYLWVSGEIRRLSES